MTSVLDGPVKDTVTFVSDADVDRAARRLLREGRISASDVLTEGRSGRFSSLDSRMAWVAIGEPALSRIARTR